MDGTIRVLKNGSGMITGALIVGEDITESRRTNEKPIEELQDRISELKSMKMRIPICSWDKKNLQEAIDKHYQDISIEGRCSECLHAFKVVSQMAK